MKRCSTCCATKPLEDFTIRRASKDGRAYMCKVCTTGARREWRAANREAHRASVLAWQKANKDRVNEKSRQWRLQNRERRAEVVRDWQQRNQDYMREKLAARRAKRVTPRWADAEKIAVFYRDAQHLQKQTGIKQHVDHIVPLNSPLVCGLHVEANLRVIPAVANLSKSNRTWPDMPG